MLRDVLVACRGDADYMLRLCWWRAGEMLMTCRGYACWRGADKGYAWWKVADKLRKVHGVLWPACRWCGKCKMIAPFVDELAVQCVRGVIIRGGL